MVEYKCLRCGYIAKQRCNLVNHLRRKNICNPIIMDISIEDIINFYQFDIPQNPSKTPQKPSNSVKNNLNKYPQKPSICPSNFTHFSNSKIDKNSNFECPYCLKVCSRNDNLKRHIRTCKIKKDKDKLEKENQELKEVIEKLVLENKKISSVTNNTTNNNNCNNDNRIVNIHINNYGQENTKYITPEYLQELIEKPFQAIPELIKFTHFNKDHPENHNIKITNKKDPFVKVLKNDKWELADRKDIIIDLIDKKHSELNNINVSEKKIHIVDRIEAFNKKYIEDDKDTINKLYKDSELIILNNS